MTRPHVLLIPSSVVGLATDKPMISADVAGENTKLCNNEPFLDSFANNSDVNGFSVYNDEGPIIHCHGFALSNGDMEASSCYKANALYHPRLTKV